MPPFAVVPGDVAMLQGMVREGRLPFTYVVADYR
jgi:hypothetical protein